jgi:hypothetical protein
MVKENQLVRAQCSHGIGAPLIVRELDLRHGGREQFNDRSNLAANKPLLGHVLKHRYFGKEFHLTHTALVLKNIASNKPWDSLAASNDPTTPDVGCAFAAPQLKIYYVPGAVLIGGSEQGILCLGRVDQRGAKFFGMGSRHAQEGVKQSRLMASARMIRTQAIVSELLNFDNRCLAVR